MIVIERNPYCSTCGRPMMEFQQTQGNNKNVGGYDRLSGKTKIKLLWACSINNKKSWTFKEICPENGYRDALHDSLEIPNL